MARLAAAHNHSHMLKRARQHNPGQMKRYGVAVSGCARQQKVRRQFSSFASVPAAKQPLQARDTEVVV